MNHLQEAKNAATNLRSHFENHSTSDRLLEIATANALIAIAEQLEYNNKLLYAHAVNKKRCKVCGHLSKQEDK